MMQKWLFREGWGYFPDPWEEEYEEPEESEESLEIEELPEEQDISVFF